MGGGCGKCKAIGWGGGEGVREVQSNFGELCVPVKKSWLRPWSVNLLLLIVSV